MDGEWELSKENIQPLRQGRDAQMLKTALVMTEEKLRQTKLAFEEELRTYSGSDPLDPWFRYIKWVEQSYPSKKDGLLRDLIQKCFSHFRENKGLDRYSNDLRMLHIWQQFAALSSTVGTFGIYRFMLEQGICVGLADFYIQWSTELELGKDFVEAGKILRKGIENEAMPSENIQIAYREFENRYARRMAEVRPTSPDSPEETRKFLGILSGVGKRAEAPNMRQRSAQGGRNYGHSSKHTSNSGHSDYFQVFDESANRADVRMSLVPEHDRKSFVPNPVVAQKENRRTAGVWTKENLPKRHSSASSVMQSLQQQPSFQVYSDPNEASHSGHRRQTIAGEALTERKEIFTHPLQQFSGERRKSSKEVSMYCKEKIYAGTSEFSFEELRAMRYQAKKAKLRMASSISDVMTSPKSHSHIEPQRDIRTALGSIPELPIPSSQPSLHEKQNLFRSVLQPNNVSAFKVPAIPKPPVPIPYVAPKAKPVPLATRDLDKSEAKVPLDPVIQKNNCGQAIQQIASAIPYQLPLATKESAPPAVVTLASAIPNYLPLAVKESTPPAVVTSALENVPITPVVSQVSCPPRTPLAAKATQPPETTAAPPVYEEEIIPSTSDNNSPVQANTSFTRNLYREHMVVFSNTLHFDQIVDSGVPNDQFEADFVVPSAQLSQQKANVESGGFAVFVDQPQTNQQGFKVFTDNKLVQSNENKPEPSVPPAPIILHGESVVDDQPSHAETQPFTDLHSSQPLHFIDHHSSQPMVKPVANDDGKGFCVFVDQSLPQNGPENNAIASGASQPAFKVFTDNPVPPQQKTSDQFETVFVEDKENILPPNYNQIPIKRRLSGVLCPSEIEQMEPMDTQECGKTDNQDMKQRNPSSVSDDFTMFDPNEPTLARFEFKAAEDRVSSTPYHGAAPPCFSAVRNGNAPGDMSIAIAQNDDFRPIPDKPAAEDFVFPAVPEPPVEQHQFVVPSIEHQPPVTPQNEQIVSQNGGPTVTTATSERRLSAIPETSREYRSGSSYNYSSGSSTGSEASSRRRLISSTATTPLMPITEQQQLTYDHVTPGPSTLGSLGVSGVSACHQTQPYECTFGRPKTPTDKEEYHHEASELGQAVRRLSLGPAVQLPEQPDTDENVDKTGFGLRMKITSGVDPWNPNFIAQLLLHLPKRLDTFTNFHHFSQPMPAIKVGQKVEAGGETFQILSLLGEGAFARAYLCICKEDNNQWVLKVQKPACPWEFYICEELKRRFIRNEKADLVNGVMRIRDAFLFYDGSILVNEYYSNGTLLDLANKFRKSNRAMGEFLAVYFLVEIMRMLEETRSIGIIHADIKPDNFVINEIPAMTDNIEVMLDSTVRSIRLIDWGRSIDMRLLPDTITFSGTAQTSGFECCEMKDGRPWTFQTDYFGLLGTCHVMLFGEYMNVYRLPNGQYKCTANFKRKWNVSLWKDFFNAFLNVPSCSEIPKLSSYRIQFEDYLRVCAHEERETWLDDLNMLIDLINRK